MTHVLPHLDALESESIHIIREVVAEFERPALLFSGGKDSAVMLHLAVKACWPLPLPFPVVHIDTGHNFDEVVEFRDRRVAELGAELVLVRVEDAIRRGEIAEDPSPGATRNGLQTYCLLKVIDERRFDAVFGGARRDEEKARAKERVFSFRDEFGQWNPRGQRPEIWSLYNGRHRAGEHFRIFPLSNWTELDIWQYIERERLEVPSIYFAHERLVFLRSGMLVAQTPLTPPRADEMPFLARVRYRTVGDATCTAAVESSAVDVAAIVAETEAATLSERGATRVDDRMSDASMEDRKREGYF